MTFTKNITATLLAAIAGLLTFSASAADTVVRNEKLHPSANLSYKVAGKRYTPLTKVSSFTQTGKASWYGNQFHGRKTSSGERYNMNAMTAAHRTLPIPSYARVTNTANGKSVIVRVNDRGPFHGSRVMDLSKAAAQQLGFIKQGTAQVKIEQIVPGQSAQNSAPQNAAHPVLSQFSQEGRDVYVDLKRFGTEREALAYAGQIAPGLGRSDAKVSVEKHRYEYIVKLGPFASQERAAEAETQARYQLSVNANQI